VKEEPSIEKPKIVWQQNLQVAPIVSTVEIPKRSFKEEVTSPTHITFDHDYKPDVKHHEFKHLEEVPLPKYDGRS